MFTHTIEVNQLDTITKHLININQQLASIKHDTSSEDAVETIKTIGLIASPFLTGFIIFLLTRNKEFRAKRAEIAGEIYLLLHDFKEIYRKYLRLNISYVAQINCVQILIQEYSTSAEYSSPKLKIYQDMYEKIEKEMLEEMNNLKQIKKSLSKHFGQYRFYLSKTDRDDFQKTLDTFYNMKDLAFSFDSNSVVEIERKLFKIITEDFAVDFRNKMKEEVEPINIFLNANID